MAKADSQAFLERLHRRTRTAHSPTLLLVDVAAAVARALDDSQAGQAMARTVRDLPGRHWIPLGGAIWLNRLPGWQPNVGYVEQMPYTLPWPAVTAPLSSPGIASSCSTSRGRCRRPSRLRHWLNCLNGERMRKGVRRGL